MKKIGILTYHRALNYGAVLQCYALQQTLIQLGYDAYVIDYRQPYIEKVYKTVNYKYLLIKLIKPHKFLRYLFEIRKVYLLKKIFRAFNSKLLRLTGACTNKTIPDDFDIYIVGSDQLWSNGSGGLDLIYTGFFKHKSSSKIYGYSISTTTTFLDSINNSTLNSIIENFEKLSFREHQIKSYLFSRKKVDVRVDVDPTLLIAPSLWIDLFKKRKYPKNVVVLYQVRGDITKRKVIHKYAEMLATNYNLKLIDLSSIKAYRVEDFLGYIYNAHYIVTSSFHATVFSVLFQKSFVTFSLGEKSDERIMNLLEMFNIQDAQFDWNNTNAIPCVSHDNITKEKLSEISISSLDYLQSL